MKITDEKIIKELIQIKNHGKTKQERMRSHAILLSNDGKTSKELAEIFFVSQRTVFQWFRDFKERGIESLSCQSGRGRKTILNVVSMSPKIISPTVIPCYDTESTRSQWIPNQVRYDEYAINFVLLLNIFIL